MGGYRQMGRSPCLRLLSISLVAVSGAYGALYERLQDLPQTEYDFIIVGGE